MENRICVFCGSNAGDDNNFREQLIRLAKDIVKTNGTLIYGGGRLGLMGFACQEVVSRGGKVIGVVPRILENHAVEPSSQIELIHVDNMANRKEKFIELADVFVVFPGGLGTMEEFFQVYSWAQLGIIKKPIVLVNIDNYYSKLIDFLNVSVEHGFMPQENVDALITCVDIQVGLKKAKHFQYKHVNKWKKMKH
ncbi:TIGR00730 family Rossman fold protein [Ligilactobacillus sp. WILCCON 0076]|uniref:Cytokinin riboside 5'-monophosphate phosphoribohydrolase n=1 Tax=Ligilactobacillus ubinensis TaxID=2876789 RepID=A0A9X2FJ64_9LACO|nr:TIGR00730 family Rossman fold protein [Ligilactobacillus ubinensis]MCP0886777.1 TIGR00730 family Rossman fold protein [Ligilactobacillus ubinensis]